MACVHDIHDVAYAIEGLVLTRDQILRYDVHVVVGDAVVVMEAGQLGTVWSWTYHALGNETWWGQPYLAYELHLWTRLLCRPR